MADGRLWFNTKIDNSQVEKDLKQLERKIRQAEASITKNENVKLPLVKQLDEAKMKLDQAREKLKWYKNDLSATQKALSSENPEDYAAASARLPEMRASVEAQEKEVENLRKQWSSVKEKVQGYDRAILQANTDIERSKAKAAELTAQTNSGGVKMSAAFAKARASAEKFRRQILRVGASMIMFRVFSAVFQGISTYMSKVLKTNEEYTAQLAKLKAALLTAFQPVYDFVLPALVSLMNILTSVVQAIGKFFAAISGKSYAQVSKNAEALYKEADAINGVGSAADKAQKSLAGFDEINTLQGSSGGSGSGVSSGESIAPDFSWLNETSDKLQEIEKLVIAIGMGLLAWKLSGSFTGGLLSALATIAAINIAADWDNISEVFGGWGDMVVGVFTADVEKMKNGFDRAWKGFLESEFMSNNIASLIMEWFGFDYDAAKEKLLSYIGEGGSMWELFSKAFSRFFDGIWGDTGDWFKERIFDPISEHWALLKKITELYWGTVGDIINGEWDEIARNWAPVANWFYTNVIKPILGYFANLFGFEVPENASDAIEAMKKPFSDFGSYLEKIFTDAWEKIVSIFSDSGEFSLKDGLIESFTKIVNSLIKGINNVIAKPFNRINNVLQSLRNIEILGITPFSGLGSISVPQIPYLAQGAVLPANKPFMAVVGDQKHGTNIEAPLATIQEAVALVMNDQISAMMAGFEALLEENRALRQTVEGIEVGDSVIGQAAARYNRKMAVVRGGL